MPGPDGYTGMHDRAGAGWYVGMEKLAERMVAGGEVHLPGGGLSVDQTGRGWTARPGIVFDVGGGASYGAGVVLSKARPNDTMSGSVAFARILGLQVGWATGPGGWRATDVRLVFGFAHKFSISGTIDARSPRESIQTSWPVVVRDATATAETEPIR